MKKNKEQITYIVKRTVTLEYEVKAYSKKGVIGLPVDVYDTMVHTRKIDKGIQVRRKFSTDGQ